jgi:hypothetical protein
MGCMTVRAVGALFVFLVLIPVNSSAINEQRELSRSGDVRNSRELAHGSCLFSLQAETPAIQKIDFMDQAQEELLNADGQTLVVFDIDGTLIDSFESGLFILYDPRKVPPGDRAFMEKVKGELEAYGKKIGVDRKRDMINSFLTLKTKKELVEPIIPELIRRLQARKIPTVALTGCPAGSFGTVPCGRTLRYSSLRRFGIDFSLSFPQEQMIFTALKAYNGDYPMFYKGILLANWKNKKGPLLGAFLDRIGWRPKKVILFDDLSNHLESVLEEMNRRDIPFRGYWYLGAQQHQFPAFNRKIAEVQLEHLMYHDLLLTPAEAAAIEGNWGM